MREKLCRWLGHSYICLSRINIKDISTGKVTATSSYWECQRCGKEQLKEIKHGRRNKKAGINGGRNTTS